jgi:hypothetical protein
MRELTKILLSSFFGFIVPFLSEKIIIRMYNYFKRKFKRKRE